VFCGSAIAPGDPPEHVIPKWMRRFRPKGGWFTSGPSVVLVGETEIQAPDVPPHLSKEPEITTPVVCKSCNGEWMSDLETWASQTIDPLIRQDSHQALSVDDQAWLAVWATKTVMTWMTVPPGVGLIPPEDYRWLRTYKLPPPKFRVRVARRGATRQRLPWSFFVPTRLGDIGNPEPAPTDIHRSILVFGHLILDIASPITVDGREPPPLDNGTFALDIWPGDPPQLLVWPPTHSFEEAEMFHFMDISPDTELPNPEAQ